MAKQNITKTEQNLKKAMDDIGKDQPCWIQIIPLWITAIAWIIITIQAVRIYVLMP